MSRFIWMNRKIFVYSTKTLLLYVVWFHVQNEIQRILMENLMVHCSKVAHFTLHLHLFLENLLLLLLWKMFLEIRANLCKYKRLKQNHYESSVFVY